MMSNTSMSWSDLRRKVLLGAFSDSTQITHPVDELLKALSSSFIATQGARSCIEPALLDATALESYPPAPPQLENTPYLTDVLRLLLAHHTSLEAHPHATLALHYYVGALAQQQRVLPLFHIVPTLAILLRPLHAQLTLTQFKAQVACLQLPIATILSTAGSRGRWLCSQDLIWKKIFSAPISDPFPSCFWLSPDEFDLRLTRFMGILSKKDEPFQHQVDSQNLSYEQAQLIQLLLMNAPSTLRSALKDERIHHLFKKLNLKRDLWIKLTQDSLLERIDSECRS